ncbi:glycosyltransferase family 2 protein [Cellulomonas sp. NPDC058312]|uniref:glycosyltransferase family 2 protein n=1 Tax=Cellulomonas sp. NPDC058312 TaxID=3346441 RepID=UPI0036E32906
MSALRDGGAHPGPDVELTVVIAAYQAQGTLGDQLDALARQTATFRWEVVVADNGSTDGTVEVARTYADRLRLRVVDASATRGAGAARNVGVSVARAPLVAFCDADDVVADDWVATVRDALRTHAFVAGRFEGARLNAPRVLRSRTLPQQDGLQESGHLPGLRAAGAGNMGLRVEVFRAVGGFDPHCRFLEDTDLCWRVQLSGVPLTWVPGAVVHVRLRGSLRSAARQGYDYGTGERWLALRYREQEARLRALAAAATGDGTGGPAGPGDVGARRAEQAGRADLAADEAREDAETLSRGAQAGAAMSGAARSVTDAAAVTAGALSAGALAGGGLEGVALAGAALAGAGIAATRPEARPGARRALRRAATTLGGLARVRSVGELGAWCWDLGWGTGYAFGRVEVPPPVTVAPSPTPAGART